MVSTQFGHWSLPNQPVKNQQIILVLVLSLIYSSWWWHTSSSVIWLLMLLFFCLYYYLQLTKTQFLLLFFTGYCFSTIFSFYQGPNNQLIYFQWWKTHNFLQQWLTQLVNNYYSPVAASLMNQILWNHKQYDSLFYGHFKDLSVVHLLIVSGLHLVLFYKIITKLFSNQKLGYWLAMGLLLLYWIAIDFSYPGFRVICGLWLRKKLVNCQWYANWSYTSLLSLCFNPLIYQSLTFLLSSGIVFCLKLVQGWKIRTTIFQWLITNLVVFLYVTLILLPINHKIYYFMIFNNLVLSPMIFALYLYLFWTWPLVFLTKITNQLISFFSLIIENLVVNKSFWPVDFWTSEKSQITSFFLILAGFFLYHWTRKPSYPLPNR